MDEHENGHNKTVVVEPVARPSEVPAAAGAPRPTLTVTDNRTGRSYEVPIADGAIPATALQRIKTGPDDFGLLSYDPSFAGTAACRSAITYIDGDRGILLYRGYPVEQLAEHSTYLETAYLLIYGELPTGRQLDGWIATSCTARGSTRT